MIAHEHPNPLAVLDAVIVDMRASGDTGHVENLLQARTDISFLEDAARLVLDFEPSDGPNDYDLLQLEEALKPFGSTP